MERLRLLLPFKFLISKGEHLAPQRNRQGTDSWCQPQRRVARVKISGLIHANRLPRNLNFSFWTQLATPLPGLKCPPVHTPGPSICVLGWPTTCRPWAVQTDCFSTVMTTKDPASLRAPVGGLSSRSPPGHISAGQRAPLSPPKGTSGPPPSPWGAPAPSPPFTPAPHAGGLFSLFSLLGACLFLQIERPGFSDHSRVSGPRPTAFLLSFSLSCPAACLVPVLSTLLAHHVCNGNLEIPTQEIPSYREAVGLGPLQRWRTDPCCVTSLAGPPAGSAYHVPKPHLPTPSWPHTVARPHS